MSGIVVTVYVRAKALGRCISGKVDLKWRMMVVVLRLRWERLIMSAVAIVGQVASIDQCLITYLCTWNEQAREGFVLPLSAGRPLKSTFESAEEHLDLGRLQATVRERHKVGGSGSL